MPITSYPERTRANAHDSDATLWLGAKAALEACRPLSRSCLRVEAELTRPTHVAEWIAANKIWVLNPMESTASGGETPTGSAGPGVVRDGPDRGRHRGTGGLSRRRDRVDPP
jgi:hypothetical protein